MTVTVRFEEKEVRSFFEILDWILKLKPAQTLQFQRELAHYEQELDAAYISSIEQIGIDKGLEKGRREGLEQGLEQGLERGLEQGLRRGLFTLLSSRFGPIKPEIIQTIESIKRTKVLENLMKIAVKAGSLEEFMNFLEQ